MNITEPKIKWIKGYGNNPMIQITVDKLPELKELIYQTHQDRDNGVAYFAEHKSGYVHYFYHTPRNQTGFGGSTFTGKLVDGSTFTVKGPWSSNSQAMNQWFPRTMEITMKVDGGLLACHMIESKVLELIKQAGAEYRFTNGYGSEDEVTEITKDSVAVIVWPGMTIKESQKYKNSICSCDERPMEYCPIHGISAQLNRTQME